MILIPVVLTPGGFLPEIRACLCAITSHLLHIRESRLVGLLGFECEDAGGGHLYLFFSALNITCDQFDGGSRKVQTSVISELKFTRCKSLVVTGNKEEKLRTPALNRLALLFFYAILTLTVFSRRNCKTLIKGSQH